MYNPVVLEGEKIFQVETSDACIYASDISEAKSLLEEAICKASRLISLRIGDYVAVELAHIATLARREDGDASLKGTFCENEIFNFKVIF